jgi:hypothetical protein
VFSSLARGEKQHERYENTLLENYEENAKEKCNLPQITAPDVDFEFLSRERGHKNLIKFPFQNEIVKQFIAGKGRGHCWRKKFHNFEFLEFPVEAHKFAGKVLPV